MIYYIIIVANAWGRGFTFEQAFDAVKKIRTVKASEKCIVYKLNTEQTPVAYVHDMGGVSYKGRTPKPIFEGKVSKARMTDFSDVKIEEGVYAEKS